MRFDCSFESGNIGKVQALNEFEYDVSVRPDTNNPHYRVWYYFSVSQVQKGQRAIFHIINGSKTKSLYRLGMTPLVRSTSRPKWERLPQGRTFYYKSPRFKKNYVLSFAFCFDKEDDTYYFAYCFPYTFTYLQRFLSLVDAQGFDFYQRELLCRTVQQRRVDLLTITNPKPVSSAWGRKKTIFITARVHSGETPASFICHGLLCFLLSDHPIARMLRSHCAFKIVPMLNPDGVFLGNYRCSSMGYDLNRNWLNPSAWAHAPIKYTRDEIIRLNSCPDTELAFFMDIHAHSTCTNAFMFVNTGGGSSGSFDAKGVTEEVVKNAMIFPKLLGQLDKTFSFQASRFCREPSKLGTGRRALGEVLHVAPNCSALEVSMYCAMDSKQKLVPYTEEMYLEIGRNVALTFVDFYKLNSFVIASARTASPSNHEQRKRPAANPRRV
ncbi:Cytosolic carboxypeptidase 6 [Diplonema papillatum]|nr:Cytosolic carboxypeptidase 6 [Diplonema papillatum]